MSEFTYLYRGINTSAISPGEMQKTLEKWTVWFKELEAKDIAEAVELSKGCPLLEVDGSVEVRPIQIFGN